MPKRSLSEVLHDVDTSAVVLFAELLDQMREAVERVPEDLRTDGLLTVIDRVRDDCRLHLVEREVDPVGAILRYPPPPQLPPDPFEIG